MWKFGNAVLGLKLMKQVNIIPFALSWMLAHIFHRSLPGKTVIGHWSVPDRRSVSRLRIRLLPARALSRHFCLFRLKRRTKFDPSTKTFITLMSLNEDGSTPVPWIFGGYHFSHVTLDTTQRNTITDGPMQFAELPASDHYVSNKMLNFKFRWKWHHSVQFFYWFQ